MPLFHPTVLRDRVTQITPELLHTLHVSALLLDVDNTIAGFTSHEPLPGTVEWAREMVQAGFRVVIVSNNFKKRVGAFAAKFGLGWISFAMKPFPFGYLKARRMLKVRCRDCAIVGDQIFTDVVGANLCGMRSVLLKPIELEEGISFRIRRYFERPLRKKFEARKEDLQ